MASFWPHRAWLGVPLSYGAGAAHSFSERSSFAWNFGYSNLFSVI